MDDLRVAERGAVSTLVLNRPAKRNAITLEMWQALPALLADLASDPELRVLVVRGAGAEAFASGADISEFERVRSDRATARHYSRVVEAADLAPLSQRGAKLMLQHLLGEGEMTESDLLAFVDQAYDSEDYREGVRAFLEKRRPRFRGR